MIRILLGVGLSLVLAGPALPASVFTTRLEDPRAVYLSAQEFGAHGDGRADDSAALQAALDKAGSDPEGGILFVPAGRYRLTRTLFVWPGVRVLGTGATRPVFVLSQRTPGFQSGLAVMVLFAGGRPDDPARAAYPVPFALPGIVPPNPAIPDAGPGTFYSAMSNIDFEIGDGNPAAIGIRFHAAQHAYLSHMDFHVGSGLAALTQIGNEAEDLHFFGGRYGILTEKPSPAWQFTLIDSSFEGQREAAIREHEAGLTLIRDSFRDQRVAIDIDPQYSDQLWVKDCRFARIIDAALVFGNERSALTQIGVENAVLQQVPVFARLPESGRSVAGKGTVYQVSAFTYGLIVPAEGRMGSVALRYEAAPLPSLPVPLPSALPALPRSDDWVNVRGLGVVGDGSHDDTAAIQRAIDSHRVLYFPSGHYVVSDTLALRPDSVLIGLHPLRTQIDLPEATAGYQGIGPPRAVLSAPAGGTNLVSGLGIAAGGENPRAVALLWKAGERSLVDDVRLLGGHGSGANPYNGNHTGDPDPHKRWDGQYPSLWVTAGGGGSFANIWTPDTFAEAGFVVSDTNTPGHLYQLSSEHHVRTEIRFDHAQNWDLNAPQTEEEAGESSEALSLEFDWSSNITIANYHGYRVTRTHAPFAAAVRLYHAANLHFRNLHVNAESGLGVCDENGCGTFLRASKYPYENAIEDVTHHLQVREREFALLDIPADPASPASADASAVLAPGAQLEQLEAGFYSIAGAAVDPAGKLYFVDTHQQRIFGWSAAAGLTIERDVPLDPVNLAFDKAGDLLVLSSAGAQGSVYSFRPGSPASELTVLAPEAAAPHPGAALLFPANYWVNGEFRDQLDLRTLQYPTPAELFAREVSAAAARQYVSPDGSVVLPAGRVFHQGPADFSGWRFSHTLDAYGLLSAMAGERLYVSNESEDRIYRARVGADGALSDLQPFVDRGGESVAVDASGNVYVANGQVFVYDPTGKPIAEIDVPERPLDLVFGGPDHRTLFILAHHSLFAVAVRASP